MEIVVTKDILKANDSIAATIRERLAGEGVDMINLLGSPGGGKTTLLESLAPHFKDRLRVGVIEGDLATSRDATRIEALNWPTVQINTGGGCELGGQCTSRHPNSEPRHPFRRERRQPRVHGIPRPGGTPAHRGPLRH